MSRCFSLHQPLDKPIVFVGGGWVDDAVLQCWASQSYLVALDGGADYLIGRGYLPDAILGDLDSCAVRPEGCPIYSFEDQESTDFDKGLRSIQAPMTICLGVLGDRMDHGLATMASLARHPMGGRTVLVGREDALCYVSTQKWAIELPIESRFSIWTMQSVDFCFSSGLQYPLNNQTLAPFAMLGTSNQTTKAWVEIQTQSGQAGYYCFIDSCLYSYFLKGFGY